MMPITHETKRDKNDIWNNQNPQDSELFPDLIHLNNEDLTTTNIIKMESEFTQFMNSTNTDSSIFMGPMPDYKEKLHESEYQIKNLKDLLKEASAICENQKIQLVETSESFQSKLQNNIVGRHSIMDFKKKETSDQEEMICKLQQTLSQLQNAACAQEIFLFQSNAKVETLAQDLQESNNILNQMKELLIREEEWLGKSINDQDMTRFKDNGLLIHAMEICIREYHNLISSSNTKLKKSESDFENTKQALHEQQQRLLSEHQDKLNQTVNEHEKELTAAKEKVANSRSHTLSLQQQLTSKENNHQKQLENYNNQVKELEIKLRHKRESYEQEAKIWQDKLQSLYRKVEDLQYQLSSLQNTNKELKTHKNELETQNESLQKSTSKLNADLIFERKQYQQLSEKDQERESKLNTLEKCVEIKEMKIKDLEKTIYGIKVETKTQIDYMARNMEKQINLKANIKIEKIAKDLQIANGKCNDAFQDIEKKQIDINTLQSELTDVKRKLCETKLQFESMAHQYDMNIAQIDKKNEEFRVLSMKHDQLQHLNQQEGQEIVRLEEQFNHLSAQLTEKTTEASLFRQRSEQLKQQFERKSEDYTALTEHKLNLMKTFNEKVREIEKLNHSLDSTQRKLRLREKRLIDLEEELDKLVGLYNTSEKELREIQFEKENGGHELIDTQSQLNQVIEERDALILMINSEKDEKIREINKLEAKLKIQEQDLKMFKQNLSASEDRASCIVFTLQKQLNERSMQVESLTNKVKSLEDILDIMKQEKEAVREEREKLAAMLNKTLINNDKLTGEVNTLSRADREKKAIIIKLENTLRKAAKKYASVESLLEHHEQDINKIKTKYKHNLHELQVSGQNLIGQHQFTVIKSSPAQLGGTEAPPQNNQKKFELTETRCRNEQKCPEQYRPTQSISAMSDVWMDLKKILTEIQNMTSEPTLSKQVDNGKDCQLYRTNNYVPRRSPSDGTVDSSVTNHSKSKDIYYHRNRKTSESDISSLQEHCIMVDCHSVVSIETVTNDKAFSNREIGQEHFSTLHNN